MTSRALSRRWVRATWAGWVLGIPCIAAFALAGEAVGIGGAQVLVGLGMGAGVGVMQGRVIRGVTGRVGPWAWSCALGLALPFLAHDIARASGWEPRYSLYACVAAGGLITGAWQAVILRPHTRSPGAWVAASFAGWTLAAGAAALADATRVSPPVRGIVGALLYLGVTVLGGLVLGAVTGAALDWMLRRGPGA